MIYIEYLLDVRLEGGFENGGDYNNFILFVVYDFGDSKFVN